MVLKMADDRRSPSPPLPPDPSQASSRGPLGIPNVQPSQEQSGGPQITPPLPMQSHQPDLERHDSLQNHATSKAPAVQPIQDAVNNAFEHSTASHQLDPDFIKIVAEQVAKTLQSTGVAPTAATQPQPSQYVPPPPPPPMPRSPTQDSTDSMPQPFTPPTPQQYREQRGSGASSPDQAWSDEGSSFSRASRESMRSDESHGSRQTPKPFETRVPSKGRRSSAATAIRRESGSESTEKESKPSRRDSRDSEASHDGTPRRRARPARVPSDVGESADTGETALERAWKPLFDGGKPTQRLSQFLRGLALHLIHDYEPKHSYVVTPRKMLRFFKETEVANENYPWEVVFGGKMSHGSISTMYRKLLAQQALLQNQDQHHEQPTIPGLTPEGFDWFMTGLIQGHPDTEFERLAKAVMNMPISNADKKSERFPKELSRRLLPTEANLQAEQRMVSSLNHEPTLFPNLKGASSMPPPPASAPPQTNSYVERERQPYSHTQHSDVIDDDDLSGPSIPIERERQPYTAREGTGRMYESEDRRPPINQLKPDPQQSTSRAPRNNSGIPPQAMYSNNSGSSDPMNIPRNSHRMSTSQAHPPPVLNGGYPKPGRGRSSPPPRNPYVRSDPIEVGSMPSSQYGSSLHPMQSNPFPGTDLDEEERMRRFHSRSRADRSNTTNTNSMNDDEINSARTGYPIPTRSSVPISNAYEYGGGGPPVGSYPARRPTMGPSGTDDRRRSVYGSPNMGVGFGVGGGDGGTDGYGSFSQQLNGNYPPQQQYGSSVQH